MRKKQPQTEDAQPVTEAAEPPAMNAGSAGALLSSEKTLGVPVDDVGALTALIDSLPIGILITSPEGRILGANQTLLQMAGGYTLEEFLQIPAADLYVDPGEREQILSMLTKESMVRDFEARVNIKGGETLWVTISTVVYPVQGSTMLITAIQDITGRKSAEQDLRLTQFGSDNCQEVILRIGPDGRIIYANEYASRLHGYEPEEMLSLYVWDLNNDVPAERWSDTWRDRRETRTSHRETEALRRDGTTFQLEITTSFLEFEGEEYIVVLGRDISERKRAEEALLRSEERFRNLFESSVDGIVVIGPDGNIFDANQAYLDMLGYTLEELKGLTYADLTPARWHDIELNVLAEQILPRGYSDEYEKEDIRKDGTPVPLSVRRWLIVSEDGEPAGMWSIARDITEPKKYEDELKRMNAELKGFAHTVSHDLRGPLASLIGANKTLQLLLKDPDVTDFRTAIIEMTEIIDSGTARADKLIGDVLSLAETAQVPSEVCPVEVSQVVAGIIADIVSEIEAREIEVRTDADLGTVVANPTHIFQIFSNVIGNAVKHIDSDRPVIEIRSLGERQGGHRYLVRDNGSGIPAEDLEKIFIPFFKGRPGSTGIGLSTVENILDVYGGSIRAYNDEGACFEFTIPDFN